MFVAVFSATRVCCPSNFKTSFPVYSSDKMRPLFCYLLKLYCNSEHSKSDSYNKTNLGLIVSDSLEILNFWKLGRLQLRQK